MNNFYVHNLAEKLRLIKIASYWSQEVYGLPNDVGYFNEGTDAYGHLFVTEGYQLIVFRGTDSSRDWVSNARIAPWVFRNKLAHKGFIKHFKSIWPAMLKNVNLNMPTIVCGHSLGAACASLAAFDLMREGHSNELHGIVFGSPNVWTNTGKPKLNKLGYYVSVVHGSDAVARVPPWPLFGPVKGQDILYFSKSGEDVWNPPKKYKVQDFELGGMKEDHMMGAYIARFKRYLDVNKLHNVVYH